ncbi:MAG TPA: hypothetical protein VIO58_05970 [Candidatus Methanoperedens sp.]
MAKRERNIFNIVYPFEQIRSKLGESNQGKYIHGYLSEINAKTVVVEEKYIDKDYLIDYAKFYARSFNIDEKSTIRLHFFSEVFSNYDFQKILIEGEIEKFETLNKSYLGFVVMKPINDEDGNFLVGRTILKTYPSEVDPGQEYRVYNTDTYQASLFGIPLKIESLPFQTQDKAVGACATTACWIALHPLNVLFGTQKESPFEVTEKSVSFASLEERNFPNSTGLSLLQMKSYFNLMGLETEFINIEKIQKKFIELISEKDDIVADAVRAYTKMKLPVIAALKLEVEKDIYDKHAVIISGYRHNNGILKELYIHDDTIGPYSRAKPKKNFTSLNNEWLNRGYKKVLVEKLMIPVYPKIRLSFDSIYYLFLKSKRKLEIRHEKITPELFLIELNQYKEFLSKQMFKDKMKILCKPFPRYLWIIRGYINGKLLTDVVFDATSVFPQKPMKIFFKI